MFDGEFFLTFAGALVLEFFGCMNQQSAVKNKDGLITCYKRLWRPLPTLIRLWLIGLTAYLLTNDGTAMQVGVAAALAILSSQFIFFWENGGFDFSKKGEGWSDE
mgnify:CR=1 FL=1